MNTIEVITKRQVLVDALLAIYGSPNRVRLDQALAQALDKAWDEYDRAIRDDG